jgi:inosose dehydratase
MRALGLTATETGPDGYLPDRPDDLRRTLDAAGLALVGGFHPAVAHQPERAEAELAAVEAKAELLAGAGGTVLALAASDGEEGYDDGDRPRLDTTGWRALADFLDAAGELAAERGLTLCLHPHAGTLVESAADVDRLLAVSSVPLCLDTGHLALGGADPAGLVAAAPERIGHVHLKDVASPLVRAVRAGEVGYRDAVRAGLYRPLGAGDAGIDAVVAALEACGYSGWYVLEQDRVLDSAGADPAADIRASLDYLRALGAA